MSRACGVGKARLDMLARGMHSSENANGVLNIRKSGLELRLNLSILCSSTIKGCEPRAAPAESEASRMATAAESIRQDRLGDLVAQAVS